MNKQDIFTIHIPSIAQQNQLLGLTKPKHPLFSLLRFEDFPKTEIEQRTKLISDLYQIVLKKGVPCEVQVQYGQTSYDFGEGVMSFFAPKQVNIVEVGNFVPQSGWTLAIHPDFFRGYPITQKIKSYEFFDYAVNEALILSDEEQKSIENIFIQIEKEANLPIDNFSQDVIISNIDLLLTYCNRYYNRQFITRKVTNHKILVRLEKLLADYFNSDDLISKGLPTAQFVSDNLNVSASYLSRLLKTLTGQSTQQHIHDKLIDKAKEKLSTTNLSVSEIAYELGFEHSQSFSKLFKTKTKLSPLEFRQSFN